MLNVIFSIQKNFSELKHLDLFNCEVTQLDDYREQVFELLPNLKFLDGFDKNDKEADEDEEDGNIQCICGIFMEMSKGFDEGSVGGWVRI